jgi:hypothetical protein
MSEPTIPAGINAPGATPLLAQLTDADRNRLAEAMQTLLARGSILGLEHGQGELYAWCRQNSDWLREIMALAGFQVSNEHESRLIQATPQKASLTLRLRQDATVVLLALWYEFDTQVRDHGATTVSLTVEQLNQLLHEKLLPDLKEPPSPTRLLEILRQAHRFNLVNLDIAEPFEQSQIEVLPTLRRVIPFQDLADWAKTAELHKNPATLDGEDAGHSEEADS